MVPVGCGLVLRNSVSLITLRLVGTCQSIVMMYYIQLNSTMCRPKSNMSKKVRFVG